MYIKIFNFTVVHFYYFYVQGMLERVGLYIQHQDFCQTNNIALKKMGKLLCLWLTVCSVT